MEPLLFLLAMWLSFIFLIVIFFLVLPKNSKCWFITNWPKTFSWPTKPKPIPVAMWSKAWVCSHSLAGSVVLNPAGGIGVCCWMSSGRGLCIGLITRPEESYRVWCVSVWSWIFDNEEALAHWGLLHHCEETKEGYVTEGIVM